MSRSFTSASSEYLEHGTAVVAAIPITMSCWCRFDDLSTFRMLMSIGDSAAVTRVNLYSSGTPKFNASVTDVASAVGIATSVTAPVVGVWMHACAVFNSSTSRAIYINGVYEAQNVTAITLGTTTTTNIGTRYLTGVRGLFMSGLIADAAIWNVALADPATGVAGGAIRALARGVSPLLIDPSNLRAYWPLTGCDTPELDRKGRYDMTVTGSAPQLAVHPLLQPLVQSRRHRALAMAHCAPAIPPEQGTIIFNVL